MKQKTNSPIFIVFDLALRHSGWAVFENNQYRDSGVLSVGAKTTEDRYDYMSYEIRNILSEISPDLVFAECTYKGTKYTVLDPVIRLQRVISDWCKEQKEELTFQRVSPDFWRAKLGCPCGKKEELKKWSIDNVKQYLHITVSDNEADAINTGLAIIQAGLTTPKAKKHK